MLVTIEISEVDYQDLKNEIDRKIKHMQPGKYDITMSDIVSLKIIKKIKSWEQDMISIQKALASANGNIPSGCIPQSLPEYLRRPNKQERKLNNKIMNQIQRENMIRAARIHIKKMWNTIWKYPPFNITKEK